MIVNKMPEWKRIGTRRVGRYGKQKAWQKLAPVKPDEEPQKEEETPEAEPEKKPEKQKKPEKKSPAKKEQKEEIAPLWDEEDEETGLPF